jgi:hypothetical protein
MESSIPAPSQQTGMESRIPSSTEARSGIQCNGSPIQDGYRTPPCVPHPRKWKFDYGPVLAPDILNIQQRLMLPKFESIDRSNSLNMADTELCGNKEQCVDAPKSTQQRFDPDSQQNHLDRPEVLDRETTNCRFEGLRKRSSNFISNAKETPQSFRGDTIFGAFKCIKMRKQV